MRSCTVHGLTDGKGYGEEWIRAEKHFCDNCRPDAWVFVISMPNCGDLEGDEVTVHLRASHAIKLGEALAQMGREIEAENRGKEKSK